MASLNPQWNMSIITKVIFINKPTVTPSMKRNYTTRWPRSNAICVEYLIFVCKLRCHISSSRKKIILKFHRWLFRTAVTARDSLVSSMVGGSLETFVDLPDDVIIHILAFCDVQTLGRLACTCKQLSRIINGDCIWRGRLRFLPRVKAYNSSLNAQ